MLECQDYSWKVLARRCRVRVKTGQDVQQCITIAMSFRLFLTDADAAAPAISCLC